MHALAVDESGKVAIIDFRDIHTHGWLRYVKGAKVYETGEVLKDTPELHRFQWPLPERARPLYAYLKGSKVKYGNKAIKFRIGFSTTTGFCIPSPHVIEANYELTEQSE